MNDFKGLVVSPSMDKRTVIHWFRKGLRIHDNPALVEAVTFAKTNECFLRPIFVLDPLIVKWLKVGPNRWRFLQQSLADLNTQLGKVNSRLYVVRGKPEEVFPRVFKEWDVCLLTFESDIEPYAKIRDQRVEELAKESQVKVIQCVSHTLYDPELVIKKNNGKAPLTYQKFLSVADSFGKIKSTVPVPETLPDFCVPTHDSVETIDSTCYDVPTLEQLGVDKENLGPNLYPGGETEALVRLEKFMKLKSWVCKFEKPNTSPNSLEPSTTVLSPYLKFGCLSSRLFYHRLKQTIGTSPHTKPPVSLIGQLMWREFYYVAGASTANFDRMAGNPICCQIPWDTNDRYLQAWTHGRTGYPFIDAIMRQLRQEGWIHHLARHAVACFLTRGDLWISWEEGQKVFEELLLDADWALNAGNWMWLSASAFFHQFFRVYSPVVFGKKTDKCGEYIRKYVPELKDFPEKFVYEPWLAPESVQRASKCVIGKDYPSRVVVHEEVYKVNIGRMSQAYKNNKERISESANVSVVCKDVQSSKSQGKRKRVCHNQMTITEFVKRNCKR